MATTHARFSAEDRRNQILETATDLFASQGYEGTTTRQIAEKVRVNEAIIFRHFPTKEDLYWAVIDHQCRLSKGRDFMEEQLRAGGDVRQVFLSLAEDFLRRREEDDRLGRLLLFTALENHGLSHRFFQTHIAEYYERLSEYIRERIDAGEFREVDPLLAARGFLGMLVYHYMIEELFGAKHHRRISRRDVAEQVVGIWLNGVAAHRSEPVGAATTKSRIHKTGSHRKSETNGE